MDSEWSPQKIAQSLTVPLAEYGTDGLLTTRKVQQSIWFLVTIPAIK